MGKKRPEKDENVQERARVLAEQNLFFDTIHSTGRRAQRNVTILQAKYVIINGQREPKKDEYKPEHDSWVYAFRGKDVDGNWLRICVAFTKDKVMSERLTLVTAMKLGWPRNRS